MDVVVVVINAIRDRNNILQSTFQSAQNTYFYVLFDPLLNGDFNIRSGIAPVRLE